MILTNMKAASIGLLDLITRSLPGCSLAPWGRSGAVVDTPSDMVGLCSAPKDQLRIKHTKKKAFLFFLLVGSKNQDEDDTPDMSCDI